MTVITTGVLFTQTNQTTPNPAIYGPNCNVIANNTAGVTGQIQNSYFSIYDAALSTTGPTGPTGPNLSYFKGSATFMLLTSILDSAPANVGSGVSAYPQLSMTYTIPQGASNNNGYMIQLTLSAGGRVANSPIFQAVPSGNAFNIILTNFFQITMPGILYTVTIEGNVITTNNLT